MKILITGCNGQLGTELQNIIRRGRSELGGLPDALKGAEVAAFDVDTLDITDRAAVIALAEKLRPDAVINSAAYTNVDACETDTDNAFRVNALGARNLAEAAEAVGAKLLHVSTDYVFSGEKSGPYDEWDVCAPQSAYGNTKHLGEQYVQAFCRKYMIVRTAWLYGYTGGNFVKTILRLAREKDGINVVNDQRGNPTNAADLAHHLLKLAASDEYGIYHCTGNGECTWFDFASEIVRLSGHKCAVAPCTTAEFPRPAHRPANSSLGHRMLRCTVGDEMRHWKDAIAEYMKHYDRESGEVKV